MRQDIFTTAEGSLRAPGSMEVAVVKVMYGVIIASDSGLLTSVVPLIQLIRTPCHWDKMGSAGLVHSSYPYN